MNNCYLRLKPFVTFCDKYFGFNKRSETIKSIAVVIALVSMIPYIYFAMYHSPLNKEWTNGKLLIKNVHYYTLFYDDNKYYYGGFLTLTFNDKLDTCLITLNEKELNFSNKDKVKNYLENKYKIGSYITVSYTEEPYFKCDLTLKEIRLHHDYNSTAFILFISLFILVLLILLPVRLYEDIKSVIEGDKHVKYVSKFTFDLKND